MATADEPVRFSELVPTSPIQPADITPEQRDAFVRDVESEMKRRGFTEANEKTAASERLTDRDFSVRINAR
jgi:hypothetical protein